MSFLSPDEAPTTATQNVESAPKPFMSPQGRKPGQKSSIPTFLGAAATPGPASGNNGGKTLLGSAA